MVEHRVSPYWHATSRDPGSLRERGRGRAWVVAVTVTMAKGWRRWRQDRRQQAMKEKAVSIQARAGPRRVAVQNVPTRMHKSRGGGQRNRGTRLGRGVAEWETSARRRTAAGCEHTVSVGVVVRAATGGAAASVPSRRLCCSFPAPGSEGENVSTQHMRRWLLFHTDGGG